MAAAAAAGSHPAVKLKKHIHLAVDAASNPPSQTDSAHTGHDASSSSGVSGGRRKSMYKSSGAGLVAAAMGMRRLTRASIPNAMQDPPTPKANVRYENTYKMEPEEGSKFQHSKIEQKIHSVLEDHCRDMTYDASSAAHLSQTIAEMVKVHVKGMFSPRYKLVTSVMVGQNQNQGMEAASRCLWDDSKDDYASVFYSNKSLMVVVLIFACYFE